MATLPIHSLEAAEAWVQGVETYLARTTRQAHTKEAQEPHALSAPVPRQRPPPHRRQSSSARHLREQLVMLERPEADEVPKPQPSPSPPPVRQEARKSFMYAEGLRLPDVIEPVVLRYCTTLAPNLAHHAEHVRIAVARLFIQLAIALDPLGPDAWPTTRVAQALATMTTETGAAAAASLFSTIGAALAPLAVSFVSELEALYRHKDARVRDVVVTVSAALITANPTQFKDKAQDNLAAVWNLFFLLDLMSQEDVTQSGTRVAVIEALRILAPLYASAEHEPLCTQVVSKLLALPEKSRREQQGTRVVLARIFTILHDAPDTQRVNLFPAFLALLSARHLDHYDLLEWTLGAYVRIVFLRKTQEEEEEEEEGHPTPSPMCLVGEPTKHAQQRTAALAKAYASTERVDPTVLDFAVNLLSHLRAGPDLTRYGAAIALYATVQHIPSLIRYEFGIEHVMDKDDASPAAATSSLYSLIIIGCADEHHATRQLYFAMLRLVADASGYRALSEQCHTLHERLDAAEVASPAATLALDRLERTVLAEAVQVGPNIAPRLLRNLFTLAEGVAEEQGAPSETSVSYLYLVELWAGRVTDVDDQLLQKIMPYVHGEDHHMQSAVVRILQQLVPRLPTLEAHTFEGIASYLERMLASDDADNLVTALEALSVFPYETLDLVKLDGLLQVLCTKLTHPSRRVRMALHVSLRACGVRVWKTSDLLSMVCGVLLLALGDVDADVVGEVVTSLTELLVALERLSLVGRERAAAGHDALSTETWVTQLRQAGEALAERDVSRRLRAYAELAVAFYDNSQAEAGRSLALVRSVLMSSRFASCVSRVFRYVTSHIPEYRVHAHWLALLATKCTGMTIVGAGGRSPIIALSELFAHEDVMVRLAAVHTIKRACFLEAPRVNRLLLHEVMVMLPQFLTMGANEMQSAYVLMATFASFRIRGLNQVLVQKYFQGAIVVTSASKTTVRVRRAALSFVCVMLMLMPGRCYASLHGTFEPLHGALRRLICVSSGAHLDLLSQVYCRLAMIATNPKRFRGEMSNGEADARTVKATARRYIHLIQQDLENSTKGFRASRDPMLKSLAPSQLKMLGLIALKALGFVGSFRAITSVVRDIIPFLQHTDVAFRRYALQSLNMQIVAFRRYKAGTKPKSKASAANAKQKQLMEDTASEIACAEWVSLPLIADPDLQVRALVYGGPLMRDMNTDLQDSLPLSSDPEGGTSTDFSKFEVGLDGESMTEEQRELLATEDAIGSERTIGVDVALSEASRVSQEALAAAAAAGSVDQALLDRITSMVHQGRVSEFPTERYDEVLFFLQSMLSFGERMGGGFYLAGGAALVMSVICRSGSERVERLAAAARINHGGTLDPGSDPAKFRSDCALPLLKLLLFQLDDSVTGANQSLILGCALGVRDIIMTAHSAEWALRVAFEHFASWSIGILREGDLLCLKMILSALEEQQRARRGSSFDVGAVLSPKTVSILSDKLMKVMQSDRSTERGLTKEMALEALAGLCLFIDASKVATVVNYVLSLLEFSADVEFHAAVGFQLSKLFGTLADGHPLLRSCQLSLEEDHQSSKVSSRLRAVTLLRVLGARVPSTLRIPCFCRLFADPIRDVHTQALGILLESTAPSDVVFAAVLLPLVEDELTRARYAGLSTPLRKMELSQLTDEELQKVLEYSQSMWADSGEDGSTPVSLDTRGEPPQAVAAPATDEARRHTLAVGGLQSPARARAQRRRRMSIEVRAAGRGKPEFDAKSAGRSIHGRLGEKGVPSEYVQQAQGTLTIPLVDADPLNTTYHNSAPYQALLRAYGLDAEAPTGEKTGVVPLHRLRSTTTRQALKANARMSGALSAERRRAMVSQILAQFMSVALLSRIREAEVQDETIDGFASTEDADMEILDSMRDWRILQRSSQEDAVSFAPVLRAFCENTQEDVMHALLDGLMTTVDSWTSMNADSKANVSFDLDTKIHSLSVLLGIVNALVSLNGEFGVLRNIQRSLSRCAKECKQLRNSLFVHMKTLLLSRKTESGFLPVGSSRTYQMREHYMQVMHASSGAAADRGKRQIVASDAATLSEIGRKSNLLASMTRFLAHGTSLVSAVLIRQSPRVAEGPPARLVGKALSWDALIKSNEWLMEMFDDTHRGIREIVRDAMIGLAFASCDRVAKEGMSAYTQHMQSVSGDLFGMLTRPMGMDGEGLVRFRGDAIFVLAHLLPYVRDKSVRVQSISRLIALWDDLDGVVRNVSVHMVHYLLRKRFPELEAWTRAAQASEGDSCTLVHELNERLNDRYYGDHEALNALMRAYLVQDLNT